MRRAVCSPCSPIDLPALLADATRLASVRNADVLPLLQAVRAEESRLAAQKAQLKAITDGLIATLAAVRSDGDRLLEVDDAAVRLACTEDWLRRNGKTLGIEVRLSQGQVRYSVRAIEALIAARLTADTC
jgi:hypothetical protein